MNNFKLIILSLLMSFSASFTQEIIHQKIELQIGDFVPPFQANDHEGKLWKYPEHSDTEYMVLYFYPAAMTGG